MHVKRVSAAFGLHAARVHPSNLLLYVEEFAVFPHSSYELSIPEPEPVLQSWCFLRLNFEKLGLERVLPSKTGLNTGSPCNRGCSKDARGGREK